MPGYLVRQETVPITGVADLLIRCLLDKQQFSDPRGEALAQGISSAAWPLFGQLWPSGQRLAQTMAARVPIAGESILEIGCGLALASMVCHRRGSLVTASDCHPLAGAFLLENLRLNALAPMRYCHGDWSAEPGQANAAPIVQGRFDLIMGSDVLYERDDGGSLPQFIERHANAQAEVLIVDPDRGNRSAFKRRMQALGYEVQETLLHQDLPALPTYRGRLLHFQRC